MPCFKVSKLARLDIQEIGDYTVDNRGPERAERYIEGIFGAFEQLTRTPEMGRRCERIRQGYRRIEFEKHVIIYRYDGAGIFISRILHERMLPSRHFIEEV